MEIPVVNDKLAGHRILLKTAGLFHGARLLLNGNPPPGKRGAYVLRGSHGREVTLKLRNTFLDPIPKLEIDGEKIRLARPLAWYEQVWMGLPVILIIAGGALGAVVGLAAAWASSRIFRSDRKTPAKYALTGLISLAAVAVFFVPAVALQIMIKGVPRY
jgi:hypothetical protein